MKVISLETHVGMLTKDKIYEVVEVVNKSNEKQESLYKILDDAEEYGQYYISRFILLSDWREQQINKILDER